MDEPTVLKKVHNFLRYEGIDGLAVSRIYSDAHATLIAHRDLAPFQRFSVDFGDFVVHPDIVAQLSDGETILTIEGKGDSDTLNGLFQAEMYQAGAHISFLAAPAHKLGNAIVQMARRKEIGVLSVGDKVEPVYVPCARMPMQPQYRSLMRQFESVAFISEQGTFTYNLPTHYLVWSIVLKPNHIYEIQNIRTLLGPYQAPSDLKAAIKGACKLGLVKISGKTVQLTDIGSAISKLLPSNIADWTSLHSRISSPGNTQRLCDEYPIAGAGLRLLLLQDPVVRIVIEGLQRFEKKSAAFSELAIACDAIDHIRTPIFFLKPESGARLSDQKGHIPWQKVLPTDYRSTTFFQYKSVLKHAGLLAPGRLGGARVKGYEPEHDIWSLSEEI